MVVGLKSFISNLYSVNTKSIAANDVFRFFGGKVFSGTEVNVNTASQHVTVYACWRDKSESVGQLPVMLMRKGTKGFDVVDSGREHRIFTESPNDFMSMQDFIEMYITCLEARGRFYAYIVRNDRGSVSEILPFRYQDNVHVDMDQNGNVYYNYTTNDGKPKLTMSGEEIMHIKLNTLDGFNGLSPIACGGSAVGLGIAQEDHLSNMMENGAMPSGILESDLVFKDRNAIERLREQFTEQYVGKKNNGKIVMVDQGLKYKPLAISPADAELLEERRYSKTDICSIFRVPPHRIGAEVGAGTDTKASNQDYYINVLMPLVVKLEFALNALLPKNLKVKLDERGFIRGDFGTTVTALGEQFKLGAISINEMRKDTGWQPIEGGEVHAIDTNNITLGQLTDVPKLQEQARTAQEQAMNSVETTTEEETDVDES